MHVNARYLFCFRCYLSFFFSGCYLLLWLTFPLHEFIGMGVLVEIKRNGKVPLLSQ
jgi:hypothetical protein